MQATERKVSQRRTDRNMMFWCVLITLLNLVYAALAHATASVMLLSCLYFLVPAAILYGAPGEKDKPNRFDAAALVWMVVIPICMGKRFGGTVNLPHIPFAAAAEALLLWKYHRGMTGITFLKRPRLKDLAWSLGMLGTLCSLLLALALILGFPQQQAALAKDHSLGNILHLIISGITSPGFFKSLALKMAVTAFIEELAYRGILLNFIEKRFGPNIALVSSSLLFGLSHIGHGGWRYGLLSALAGLGFGKVYQKTRCLGWSMGVHGSLDTIARLLFLFK